MVKIRLKRLGAKKRPFYRLVVADARSPRDGRFIEELGTYDPIATPAAVRIDGDRVLEWMRRGAQPSDTARSLLEQQGILPRSERARRAPSEAPAEAAATPAGAASAPATEPTAETAAAAAASGDDAELAAAADVELAAAAETAEEA